jgi:DNA invertase Pin-like site-specific DNA recombinase
MSVQETRTDSTPELAEVLYAIVGWTARMESKRMSERARARLARAAKEGRLPGRPFLSASWRASTQKLASSVSDRR